MRKFHRHYRKNPFCFCFGFGRIAPVESRKGSPLSGALAGILFERLIKQRKKHGNRLIWPPEFNYYPTGSQSAQEVEGERSEPANESLAKKAG